MSTLEQLVDTIISRSNQPWKSVSSHGAEFVLEAPDTNPGHNTYSGKAVFLKYGRHFMAGSHVSLELRHYWSGREPKAHGRSIHDSPRWAIVSFQYSWSTADLPAGEARHIQRLWNHAQKWSADRRATEALDWLS